MAVGVLTWMTMFALSAANYRDLERQNDVFEKSAIYSFTDFRLACNGDLHSSLRSE